MQTTMLAAGPRVPTRAALEPRHGSQKPVVRYNVFCRVAAAQPRLPSRHGRFVPRAEPETATGGGDDSPPEDPPTGGDGNGDDGEDEDPEKEIEDVLAEAGMKTSSLPDDMIEGLRLGLLSADDVRRWLVVRAIPVIGALCKAVPAFRDRVMGNPRFLLVLAIELGLGVIGKTIAEVQFRGDRFWKEIPFVMSDLALECIGNFSVVWLLSPKCIFKPIPMTGIMGTINRLPPHAFHAGSYSLAQRFGTVFQRLVQFFSIGFCASGVGHSITKAAVEAQQKEKRDAYDAAVAANAGKKKKDQVPLPKLEEEVELAPVFENSVAWGAFMGCSTNLRYQLVNGFEECVMDALIPNVGVKSFLTFWLRFANTTCGGYQWVWFANKIGLQ